MNYKLILCTSMLLLLSGISKAQNFTFGIENGINYSNIRKTFDYDRFQSQPGPINGIFAKYQLGNWFLLQTGISHTTINFEETQWYYTDYWMYTSSTYYPASPVSSCIMPPSSSYNTTNHYSFLRVPLLAKFRTPGRLNFEIGGGYYYSFMTNDEFRGKDKDHFDEEYRNENFPDMTDWGWILTSSINYNINKKWSIFASGQVTYGKEEYFENVEGKMGSTELTFGIGYKPFANQNGFVRTDSTRQHITILPHSGINISRVKSSDNNNEYHSSVGFNSGISLQFSFVKNISFITGSWYERKGYNLQYVGYYPAVYYVAPNDEPSTQMNSEVQLDYLTIPLLMSISLGEKIQSHINFGIYYSLLQNAFAIGERTNSYQHDNGYQVTKEFHNQSHDLLFKNYDKGFIMGYRVTVPLFTWAGVFASVNKSFGTTNIIDGDEDVKTTYPFIVRESFKNNSTAIVLGISIPVNKN